MEKDNKGYAPIVVFTYCRKKNTELTINSLLENEEAKFSDLIVFSDAPKNTKAYNKVKETRNYLHCIRGFKSVKIIERDTNFGLAKNIMAGVTEVVNKYGSIIVLEDDMTVSRFFLRYMNQGLRRYENDANVASIHGYMYPIATSLDLPETFFIKGADCWGWATWLRAWNVFTSDADYLYKEIAKRRLIKTFEFDYSYGYYTMLKRQKKGVANSWAVCWYASAFLHNMLTLYPNQSLVQLNGLDGIGATHGEGINQMKYYTEICPTPVSYFPDSKQGENIQGRKCFKDFFLSNLGLRAKIAYLLRKINIRL